jgi:hypothetical protein
LELLQLFRVSHFNPAGIALTAFVFRDYLEKFFVEQELQLINAYEQNNSSSSSSSLNPQLSSEQSLSKRRLSSDLFLKPMSTAKRTKPLINTTDNDQLDLNEHQQTIRSSSPILTKKLNEEIK